MCLDARCLAQKHPDAGSGKVESEREAERVRQLSGQAQCVVDAGAGLIRIPEAPECPRSIGEARHLGILRADLCAIGSVLMRIVECHTLFEMLEGGAQLAEIR